MLPATHPTNRKLWLWVVLGMTALSVFDFVDLPLLTTVSEHGKHLAQELPVLVPHMICGFIALCIGPLQFSSRLRQGNIKRHRLLGKIYACAIIAGAIGGYLLVWGELLALWSVCGCARIPVARHGRHCVHGRKQAANCTAPTMDDPLVCGYFFFVLDRVPFEFPAFQPSEAGNVCLILTLCILAILIPDIAFTWSYLTDRRK